MGHVEEFYDWIYEDKQGFVYIPSLDPVTNKWDKKFFEWPAQRTELIQYVVTHSEMKNVFFAPALRKKPESSVVQVLGSNVVWAEFDGNYPDQKKFQELGIPLPHWLNQSSTEDKVHAYWKLEQFSTDLALIQNTNRSLAYALGADTSGWDLGQLLRPPGSLNHKYEEPLPVFVRESSDDLCVFNDFEQLPEIKTYYTYKQFDRELIPSFMSTMHSFIWTPAETNIIYKPKPGKVARHRLLSKAGIICAQKGMSNEQIFAVLERIDSRPHWRKFADRTNSDYCYVSVIDYVRNEVGSQSGEGLEPKDPLLLESYGFMEHLTIFDNLVYIVDRIAAINSQIIFMGQSDVGKTMVVTEWLVHMALGRDWLSWKIEDSLPRKILYLSLEMNAQETNERHELIKERYSKENQELLNENFMIYSAADGFNILDDQQYEMLKYTLKKYDREVLFVDSLTNFVDAGLSDEDAARKAVKRIKFIRDTMNIMMVFIHHPRKPANGMATKTTDNNESYGSAQIVKQSTTQFHMSRMPDPEDPQKLRVLIEISKGRLGARSRSDANQFIIDRLPNGAFKRVAAHELPPALEDVTAGVMKFGQKKTSSPLDTLVTPYKKPIAIPPAKPTIQPPKKIPPKDGSGGIEF